MTSVLTWLTTKLTAILAPFGHLGSGGFPAWPCYITINT